jgi:hypothetical protein
MDRTAVYTNAAMKLGWSTPARRSAQTATIAAASCSALTAGGGSTQQFLDGLFRGDRLAHRHSTALSRIQPRASRSSCAARPEHDDQPPRRQARRQAPSI